MSRIIWKENKVVCIETDCNVFVLAQLLVEPYLLVFNKFQVGYKWDNISISNKDILLCKPVTRQFLQNSTVRVVAISPILKPALESKWIDLDAEAFSVKLFSGTKYETDQVFFGENGGVLVKKDIFINKKSVLMPLRSDSEDARNYESTSLEIFPNFNRRLYLCYKFGHKIVDPELDVAFRRPIPLEYAYYFGLKEANCKEEPEKPRKK